MKDYTNALPPRGARRVRRRWHLAERRLGDLLVRHADDALIAEAKARALFYYGWVVHHEG